MSKKLEDIIKPISGNIKQFEQEFKLAMKSQVALVDLVARYIVKTKGKKIRPVLVLLSAELAGSISERTYRAANLVELLHTATLVHDDVVDDAEERRGFASINKVWKNKVAVLMGDYLLSRGLMLAVDSGDFDFLQVTTKAVKRMSEGELLQIGKTKRLNIDEETYFRIISDKTASLISTCCQVGAQSATKDENIVFALRDFGEYLGLAFQIKDDILDFIGKNTGKKIGIDLKEKKLTLPLIYALKTAPKKESSEIRSIVAKGKTKEFDSVIDFVQKYKGIDYTEEVALGYINKCKNSLDIFPDSEIKQAMLDLVDFVVERKK